MYFYFLDFITTLPTLRSRSSTEKLAVRKCKFCQHHTYHPGNKKLKVKEPIILNPFLENRKHMIKKNSSFYSKKFRNKKSFDEKKRKLWLKIANSNFINKTSEDIFYKKEVKNLKNSENDAAVSEKRQENNITKETSSDSKQTLLEDKKILIPNPLLEQYGELPDDFSISDEFNPEEFDKEYQKRWRESFSDNQ